MPALSKRRTSSAELAATAVIVAVAWYISFVFGAGMPGWARVPLVVVGGMVAPTLASVAAVRLVAPALAFSRRRTLVVAVALALAFVSIGLVGVSFSVGMNDADAGRPAGLLASLTTAFAAAAVLAAATAIALLLFGLLRRDRPAAPRQRGVDPAAARPGGTVPAAPRPSVRRATVVAVGVSILVTPFVLLALLAPLSIVLLCVGVAVFALLPVGPRTGQPRRPAATAVPAGVRDRVTLYAAVSLAVTLVVWTGGVAASIRGTGTDAAGTSLGVAAALGQLAVVPLLWAATLAVAARAAVPARTVRVGFVAASVLVVLATVVMVVGLSPDGDLYLRCVAVVCLGVGVWAGTAGWAVTAGRPPASRAMFVAVVVLAAAVLYGMLVALSGGVSLALVSGFLAFGGARLLLRSSPGTLPASS